MNISTAYSLGALRILREEHPGRVFYETYCRTDIADAFIITELHQKTQLSVGLIRDFLLGSSLLNEEQQGLFSKAINKDASVIKDLHDRFTSQEKITFEIWLNGWNDMGQQYQLEQLLTSTAKGLDFMDAAKSFDRKVHASGTFARPHPRMWEGLWPTQKLAREATIRLIGKKMVRELVDREKARNENKAEDNS